MVAERESRRVERTYGKMSGASIALVRDEVKFGAYGRSQQVPGEDSEDCLRGYSTGCPGPTLDGNDLASFVKESLTKRHLSTDQRKRLAMIVALLEVRPIQLPLPEPETLRKRACPNDVRSTREISLSRHTALQLNKGLSLLMPLPFPVDALQQSLYAHLE